MDLDRKTVTYLTVSGGVLVVFVAAAVFVSQTYATGNGGGTTAPSIQPEGGLAMLGVIVLFVLLMAGVGLFVSRSDLD